MFAKLLGLGLLAVTSTVAFAQTAFVEGKDYFRLKAVQLTQVPKDKVEVVELFRYGCPACASMEKSIVGWKKTMPAQAAFRRIHVTFGDKNQEALSRTYLAVEAMGVADRAHPAMFKEIEQGKQPSTDFKVIADRFTTMGLDGKKFLGIVNSFSVTQKVKQNEAVLPRYEAGGTPEFIVAGKYRAPVIVDHQTTLKVVTFLIQKELTERGIKAQ
jgi:protein dithiol oxidoreductase (disulfide-forming)